MQPPLVVNVGGRLEDRDQVRRAVGKGQEGTPHITYEDHVLLHHPNAPADGIG
jgi:hypothetical protein